ncbi:MAG: hypothetical protein ACREP6_11755 [Candidatus Binataceae bacterium]
MSQHLGDKLPPDFLSALDGRDLARKFGQTYILLTADPGGLPRPCMLSAGELLALDERTIRAALWPGGKTGANLRRDGRIVICFVAPGVVLYVRGGATALGPCSNPDIERFQIKVDSVESDAHEGLPVVSGIVFTAAGDEVRRKMLDGWNRVLIALREN